MTRIREIDGLRALAVSSVILYHWTPYFRGGFVGVDLFFVISGFVITRGLLEGIDLRDFYRRRFFRIVPPLAAMLTFFALLLGYDRIPALAAMFSVMNWYRSAGNGGGIFGHAWSLSIEEQFYLLWPLCCGLLMARGGMKRTLIIALVGIALWRILAFRLFGMDRIYNGLDTRSDGLLLGCLLATFPIEFRRWWIPASGFVAIILFAHMSPKVMLALPLVNLCSAGLIASCRQPTPSRLLTTAPVQWLGARSYAIYLWHYPIGALLLHGMGFATCLALTFLAAELSWRLVERPALNYKRLHTAPRQLA